MLDYSHQTHIKAIEDIYNFRSKVFDIVKELSNNPISPSKLAGLLSSSLRKILSKQNSFTLDICFTFDEQTVQLRICEVETSSATNSKPLLEQHFSLPKNNNVLKIIKTMQCILLQKTREELMSEVEDKNHRLQVFLEKANLEKNRMEQELNIAKDIQLSMLPLVFPPFPERTDIDIYAKLIPAREVGGDFYDFYFLDEKHLGLVVGDVSGKGVPAALMMAVCKTLLKSSTCNGFSTANILSHVNNEMAKDNSENMFVTVFMAILNTSTGEMTYTNAGHSPTYIKKKSGAIIKLSTVHGPVIAAMYGLKYKEEKIILDPGDVLFAYTDGITEAHNEAGELFSDQKLCNLLLNTNFNNVEDTVKHIIQTTKLFEGSREQFDDITALCVEYKSTITTEEKLTVAQFATLYK